MSTPREWDETTWDVTPVVFDLRDPLVGPICWADWRGYVCTRREGHGGRHAAGTGQIIVAVWEQS